MGIQNAKSHQRAETIQLEPSVQAALQTRPVESDVPSYATRLEETVVHIGNQYRYGQLYSDFLKARKSVFIDQKEWDLPHTEGMEFDQYDTP